MLIFQLRIEEVRRFDSVLENAFFSNIDEYHGGMPYSMVKALSYIESFIRNKIDLFDFNSDNEKEKFIRKLMEGHCMLKSLMDNMSNLENKIKGSELKEFLDFKAYIIKGLYKLTLNKL